MQSRKGHDNGRADVIWFVRRYRDARVLRAGRSQPLVHPRLRRAPARSVRPTDSCRAPGRSGWSRRSGPSSRCGAGTSGGDDFAVFVQAGGKTLQGAVLVRAAALDEERFDPRLRRAQSVDADGARFCPTTARGSIVTPMSAATQPIMPSSVPSSKRAADGQPNSESTCSSRCR